MVSDMHDTGLFADEDISIKELGISICVILFLIGRNWYQCICDTR